MALLDNFSKTYTAFAKCKNCQAVQEVRVPKGETVQNFFASERGLCNNCRCATLEPYKKPEINSDNQNNKDGDKKRRGDKIEPYWMP